MSLVDFVRSRTVSPTHELLTHGWTKKKLARAVYTGELVRVRQGWYCAPDLPLELQEAFRVGGALTCTTAGRMLGLSVRDTPHLHVAVPPHASRLRQPQDRTARLGPEQATVHWSPRSRRGAVILSVGEVLSDMAFCQPVDFTIAAVDSALRLRLITTPEWARLCESMPRRLRRLLSQVTDKAESITESLVRTRLLALGITTRVQVRIRGVGRVDLVVGDRLVIEVDGFTYHSNREDFEKDRHRDALLSIRGYRVLRFSYNQVMGHWGDVRDSVLAAIARGDHLA